MTIQYVDDCGLYGITLDNGGAQLSWSAYANGDDPQTVPLSPNAARMVAWELLRRLDPGLLADPFRRPRMAPERRDADVIAFPDGRAVR